MFIALKGVGKKFTTYSHKNLDVLKFVTHIRPDNDLLIKAHNN